MREKSDSKKFGLTSGFTLLEILLVVGVIAVLTGIVILAINPSKQLATSRNMKRSADVNTIRSALMQYVIDTGSLPPTITTGLEDICSPGSSSDCIDLSVLIENQKYLADLPTAPGWEDENTIGYAISLSSSGGSFIINAQNAELGVVISSPPGIVVVGGGGEDCLHPDPGGCVSMNGTWDCDTNWCSCPEETQWYNQQWCAPSYCVDLWACGGGAASWDPVNGCVCGEFGCVNGWVCELGVSGNWDPDTGCTCE